MRTPRERLGLEKTKMTQAKPLKRTNIWKEIEGKELAIHWERSPITWEKSQKVWFSRSQKRRFRGIAVNLVKCWVAEGRAWRSDQWSWQHGGRRAEGLNWTGGEEGHAMSFDGSFDMCSRKGEPKMRSSLFGQDFLYSRWKPMLSYMLTVASLAVHFKLLIVSAVLYYIVFPTCLSLFWIIESFSGRDGQRDWLIFLERQLSSWITVTNNHSWLMCMLARVLIATGKFWTQIETMKKSFL